MKKSDYLPYLRTLRRVPDDVMLAVATREIEAADRGVCVMSAPFARPFRRFLADLALSDRTPSPRAQRIARQTQQAISGDGTLLLAVRTVTLAEFLAEPTPLVDRLRAVEGQWDEGMPDLYTCARCFHVSTVPERCPACGEHRS